MEITAFIDEATFTLTYVVYDDATRDAIIIDPVLNFDPLASQTSTESVEKVTVFVRENELKVRHILETHAHADHLSGAQLLKKRFGAPVGIGERITVVQATFKKIYDLPDNFPIDGSQFDQLVADGEVFQAGSITIEAIPTPGHTPACSSYKIGDAVFTGDALFMDDFGTGRCDFPNGSAEDLYESVHERLYALPDETRVFVGHDYQPGGRELRYETTIGSEKANNIQLKQETTREEYVAFRTKRDAVLNQPKLLFPSIQINIDAGRLPEKSTAGGRYLRIPINFVTPTNRIGGPVEEVG